MTCPALFKTKSSICRRRLTTSNLKLEFKKRAVTKAIPERQPCTPSVIDLTFLAYKSERPVSCFAARSYSQQYSYSKCVGLRVVGNRIRDIYTYLPGGQLNLRPLA